MPEELKNTTIQIDSKTAEQIAGQYITFKYVEHISLVILTVCLGLLVWKICKKAMEDF